MGCIRMMTFECHSKGSCVFWAIILYRFFMNVPLYFEWNSAWFLANPTWPREKNYPIQLVCLILNAVGLLGNWSNESQWMHRVKPSIEGPSSIVRNKTILCNLFLNPICQCVMACWYTIACPDMGANNYSVRSFSCTTSSPSDKAVGLDTCFFTCYDSALIATTGGSVIPMVFHFIVRPVFKLDWC